MMPPKHFSMQNIYTIHIFPAITLKKKKTVLVPWYTDGMRRYQGIYMVFLLYFTRTVYNTKYNVITLYINNAASYMPDMS